MTNHQYKLQPLLTTIHHNHPFLRFHLRKQQLHCLFVGRRQNGWPAMDGEPATRELGGTWLINLT